MRRLFFLLLFPAAWVSSALCQTAWKPLLSPYVKAVAYSKQQSDLFSAVGNQAALASIHSFSAGVYGEQKFMLDELNNFSSLIALPTSSGTFGLQLLQLGSSNFAQNQIGLAYSRSLSDKVNLGVQFNYYSLRASGYGNAGTMNLEAGALFRLTDQLSGGLHIANPVSGKLGKLNKESLLSVYSMGFGYDASDHFYIGAEVEKTENKSLDVNASLQYRFTDRIQARGGISSGASLIFFGVGFKLADFRVDATASVHPQLGLTPGLLLIYNKTAKK